MEEKGRAGIIILVIVVILILGAGGYLLIHNMGPDVKDTDGKDIYQKGFIYEKTLWGWEVRVGDTCTEKDGQSAVWEKHLWDDEGETKFDDRSYSTGTIFECPNGCEGGACIR